MVGINKYQHSAERNDTSYLRKIRKPMVERKRRERMNQSITQLRALIDDTVKQQVAPMTRVDKADILELTVSHLTQLRQQRRRVTMVTDDRASYASGFQDCLREVTSFLLNNRLIDDGRMADLSRHLHVTFNRSTKQFVSVKGLKQVSTPQQSYPSINMLKETPYEIRNISPIISRNYYDNNLSLTGSCFHGETFESPYINGSSTSSTGSGLFQDRTFNSSCDSSVISTPNSSSSLSEFQPVCDAGASTSVTAENTSYSKSYFTSVCDINGSTNGGDRTVSIGTGNENKIGHVISESTWRPW